MIDRSLLTHLHIRHHRGRRRLCDAFSSHTARGAAAWACSLSNRGGSIMASSAKIQIGILLLQHARAILQTRAGASHRRSSTHVCSLSCSSSKRGSQKSRSDSRRRLAEPCGTLSDSSDSSTSKKSRKNLKTVYHSLPGRLPPSIIGRLSPPKF